LNNRYLSPQELRETIKSLEHELLKETLDEGTFFPGDVDLSKLKQEERFNLAETIHALPLKEFLSRGQTLGDYLVAAKIHDVLMSAAIEWDRVPYMSAVLASDYVGSTYDVMVANRDLSTYSYRTGLPVSGATIATETVATTRARITPTLVANNTRIAEDLLEDAGGNASLIEFSLKWAAEDIALKASSLMTVAILNTGATGVGTQNTITADATEVKWGGSDGKDVVSAQAECAADGFFAQTMITQYESYHHSISASLIIAGHQPAKPGFHDCINNVDIYVHPVLVDLTNATPKYQTLMFDRRNALFTVRKRWLAIENYGDPVKGLAGAIIKGRQGSATMYNAATCVMTEA
jgi:hypothetical protein